MEPALTAYSTPPAAHEGLTPAFEKTGASKNVTSAQSSGASGARRAERSRPAGLPTDVAALAPDIDRLVKAGGEALGTGAPRAKNGGPPPSRTGRRSGQEAAMSDHVYRVVEVVGSSAEGIDAAIRNAVTRAGRTTRNLDWFEVTQIRGQIEDGRVAHYQVGIKLGFRLEDT